MYTFAASTQTRPFQLNGLGYIYILLMCCLQRSSFVNIGRCTRLSYSKRLGIQIPSSVLSKPYFQHEFCRTCTYQYIAPIDTDLGCPAVTQYLTSRKSHVSIRLPLAVFCAPLLLGPNRPLYARPTESDTRPPMRSSTRAPAQPARHACLSRQSNVLKRRLHQ